MSSPPIRSTTDHPLLLDWAENLDDISYDGFLPADQHHPASTVAGLGQLTDGVFNDNRTTNNGSFFGKFVIHFIQNIHMNAEN